MSNSTLWNLGSDEFMPLDAQAEYFGEIAADWFDAGLDCRSNAEMAQRIVQRHPEFEDANMDVWIDTIESVRGWHVLN